MRPARLNGSTTSQRTARSVAHGGGRTMAPPDHARAHAAASVVALGIAVAWSPLAARALMLFLVSSTHGPRLRWRRGADPAPPGRHQHRRRPHVRGRELLEFSRDVPLPRPWTPPRADPREAGPRA